MDAEAGITRQHSRPRPESQEAATGIIWDEAGQRWVSEESLEETSQRTAVGEVAEQDKEKINKDDSPIWIEWDSPTDPGNPFNWSKRKKWTTTWISCIFTLVVAFAGAAFSMGTTSMIAELGCSQELAVLGLSAFPLGFGLAPLVLAPFSEAYGRYPMYVCSSIVYCIFFLPITLGKNIATVIVARLIGGLAASTGSTLVGGTVADLFITAERGLPMSIFSFCAFAGTGLGPAVMGYVEQYLGWRWISWIQMIMAGVMSLAIVLLTRETRGSVILSRRARKLRKSTGDPRHQCRSDAERASLAVLIRVSMTRPIYLLCTEAIVACFSLWVGFAWGVLYLSLRAVPLVFQEYYSFTIGEVGLVFFAVVFAAFLGYFTNLYQEQLYQKHHAKRGPEARLYMSMAGGLIFPAGCWIFAFASGRGHWMGPVVGLVMVFYGVFTIYLATFNYLADSYTIYASSALSGQSLCRNLAGFAFPLFTSQMYNRLGYQWASFLAGCLALVLAITPFVLYAFGPKIRAKSRFAKELARMREGQ
ncbi:MFS general substrate transporter [Leucosporidium creatinivorum]|uniref:MFS general substrate transporter n=1 Tax=Leucosporidium creatinivorum TaxID=106004 RepID=A0A1Y2ETY7_9BASI|nr:MFS general substrate transporter [Leucosporidium creatinivorum]